MMMGKPLLLSGAITGGVLAVVFSWPPTSGTTPAAVSSSIAVISPSFFRTVSPTPTNTPTPLPSVEILESEINLDVPFTMQAPNQNWNLPYQEFCEEASMVMAAAYTQGKKTLTPAEADQLMLNVMDYENETFGYYKDTTAAETAEILRNYFQLQDVRLVNNPTEQDFKQALSENKIILVPAAGQLLGNPNFRAPGPPYHMLVIKGYTSTGQFITNDPGTRKGADYPYSADVILEAMHDWNNGDVESGQKVAIIVGR